jgi:DNA-binding LytR/AlgR family response regulator
MEILICDDMPLFSHSLSRYIKEYDFSEEEVNITCFDSGKEVLNYLDHSTLSDLIFMDICLGKENGIDIATTIKKIFPYSLVVFTSYFDNFYHEMVNVEPFGFIKKPVEKKSIFNVLDRALARLNTSIRKFFYLDFKGATYRVDLNQVIYIYSDNRTVHLKLKNGHEYSFYDKLDTVYEKVSAIHPYLARINKSYIVNIMHVTKYTAQYVFIDDLDFKRSKNFDKDFNYKMKDFQNTSTKRLIST